MAFAGRRARASHQTTFPGFKLDGAQMEKSNAASRPLIASHQRCSMYGWSVHRVLPRGGLMLAVSGRWPLERLPVGLSVTFVRIL